MAAIPEHTIIRYSPNGSVADYPDDPPVLVRRYRFFRQASHQEVTGEARGVDWENDWSSEQLTGGTWRILGRCSWPNKEVAEEELDRRGTGVDMYRTFDEAITVVRASLHEKVRLHAKWLANAQRAAAAAAVATCPDLPA